jgi:carboxypeptidase C (cathepsin A)
VTDDHMGEAMTEPCVTTRHAIDLPGGQLDYQAQAGTVRVGRDDGSPLADVFYLAYRAESGATRPVTFAFNGGPGSASLWLNVGGFGPRRAPTLTPHATPPAPYAFGDNPHTLLAVSDLVFLDAVGTGFSRLAGDGRPDEVWGVDQDVEVFARAILGYLTMTGSWQAPRYLFGESYGTSRAAALVYRLQNLGADFNGVIMLSTLLNWATTQPGLDQGYINLLPSYAAAAWYHGKARPAGQPLTGFLDGAREFAHGDYAAALQQGDRLPAATEHAVAARLADLTGLDVTALRRKKLRIDMEDFRRELLGQEGKLIGRFDTRFCADHQYVIGTGAFDPATDDAATAGVNSAHLSGFHQHLVTDLGYRSHLHYRPLNNVTIAAAWDWRHKAPGIDAPLQVPNVALDLSAAMRRNPALRVYIMGGVYDLATPFAGAEFDISHLYLSERLRRNVQFSWYESGHMTFVDEKVIPVMASDLARFYASPPDRAAGLGVEQAGLVSGDDELDPVPGAQLGQQMGHVRFGGARGDEQGGGDLGVGHAQAHQPEDLAFAAGDPGQLPGLAVGTVLICELPDQAAADARRDHGVAGRDHPDGGQDVLQGHVLDQEPARPGPQRAVDVVILVERRPDSVSRLVASMTARASRPSAGLASQTLRPEPAWIAMTPMLCATMSCSSRAIRSRSAVAAWAAAWARTSSARACACRIEFPMSQAMIMARGTAIVTKGTGPPGLPFGGPGFGDGSSRIRIGRPAPATASPVTETARVRVAAM